MEALPPHGPSPLLRYPEGWRELLEAPDTEDYRLLLGRLADLTQQRLAEIGNPLAQDKQDIAMRWQQALEFIADVTIIDPQAELNEAQRIEAAILTLQ